MGRRQQRRRRAAARSRRTPCPACGRRLLPSAHLPMHKTTNHTDTWTRPWCWLSGAPAAYVDAVQARRNVKT